MIEHMIECSGRYLHSRTCVVVLTHFPHITDHSINYFVTIVNIVCEFDICEHYNIRTFLKIYSFDIA